ncbi:MAG: SUMF1/EgtB/PvdO family nonheme iron enzyme [Candidatus Binatia bacterium]
MRYYTTHQDVRSEAWYDDQEQEETTDQWALRLWRRQLLYLMTNAADRVFFHACREAVAAIDKETLESWLAEDCDTKKNILRFGGEKLFQVFHAHLLCAKEVVDHANFLSGETLLERLRPIVEETQQPLPLLQDLTWELFPAQYRPQELQGKPRSVARQLLIAVLLIEQRRRASNEEGKGVVATLTLSLSTPPPEEAQANRRGVLYPSTELALVSRNDEFSEAEHAAGEYLESMGLWTTGLDVHWQLERRDGKPINSLTGPSMGAAFALGMARLLADGHSSHVARQLQTLSLSGIAASAKLQDETLYPVGGMPQKLSAAAFGIPHIHTVVIAKDQPLDMANLQQDERHPHIFRDPNANFFILRADTVTQAIELLTLLAIPGTRLSFADALPRQAARLQQYANEGTRTYEDLYFSKEASIPIKYKSIAFHDWSESQNPLITVQEIAQKIKEKKTEGQYSVVITDFSEDLRETLWALSYYLKTLDVSSSASSFFIPYWLRSDRLKNHASASVDHIFLEAIFSGGRRPEQLSDLLSDFFFSPTLFLVDFSYYTLREYIKDTSDNLIANLIDAVGQFCRLYEMKDHRVVVGLPRYLLAHSHVEDFVSQAFHQFYSAGLFSDHYGTINFPDSLSRLPQSFANLGKCNSHTLSFAIEDGLEQARTDLLSLASFLGASGYHEIAYRLELYERSYRRREATRPLVSIVKQEKIESETKVPAIVLEDSAEFPRITQSAQLSGVPGSGKTTLLKQIECEWALPKFYSEGIKSSCWLPVYLSLALPGDNLITILREQYHQSSGEFGEILKERSQRSGAEPSFLLIHDSLKDWATPRRLRFLFSSPIYFLFDAINEVNKGREMQLSREIDRLAEAGLNDQGIVVAFRTDLLPQVLAGSDQILLQPFSPVQVEGFVAHANADESLIDVLGYPGSAMSRFIRNPFVLGLICDLPIDPEMLKTMNLGNLIDQWVSYKTASVSEERTSPKAKEELRRKHLPDIAWTMKEAGEERYALLRDRPGWLTHGREIGLLAPGGSEEGAYIYFHHSLLMDYFVALKLAQHIEDEEGSTSVRKFFPALKNRQIDYQLPLQILFGLLNTRQRTRLLPLIEEIFGYEITLRCLTSLSKNECLEISGLKGVLNAALRDFYSQTNSDSEEPSSKLRGINSSEVSERSKLPGIRPVASDRKRKKQILDSLSFLDPRFSTNSFESRLLGREAILDGQKYRLGRYPVTNLQFAAFIEDSGYCNASYWKFGYKPQNISHPKFWHDERYSRPNYPVVGVNIFEAMAYCQWLNSQPEQSKFGEFTIPTVDQWDWIAFNQDDALFSTLRMLRQQFHVAGLSMSHFNDDDDTRLSEVLAVIAPGTEDREIQPVGLGAKNGGCFDLWGNVWEWCNSRHVITAMGKTLPLSSAHDPTVVKGGPTLNSEDHSLLMFGGRFDPYLRHERLGFRIVQIEHE